MLSKRVKTSFTPSRPPCLALPFPAPENKPFSLDLAWLFLVKYSVGVFCKLQLDRRSFYLTDPAPVHRGKIRPVFLWIHKLSVDRRSEEESVWSWFPIPTDDDKGAGEQTTASREGAKQGSESDSVMAYCRQIITANNSDTFCEQNFITNFSLLIQAF